MVQCCCNLWSGHCCGPRKDFLYPRVDTVFWLPCPRQAAAVARKRFDIALQAADADDEDGVMAQLESWKQDTATAGEARCSKRLALH